MRNEDVIVGVDGSPGSNTAVRWAAVRARHTGGRLRLLHAYTVPITVPAMSLAGEPPYSVDLVDYARAGEGVLATAQATVRSFATDLDVSTELLVGGASQVLIDASARADLVVVGSRGLGGFAGLLLGSVSVQVSGHAHCPTVVVRGSGAIGPVEEGPILSRNGAATSDGQITEAQAVGPVVVGVDGSRPSRAALAFAFAEADRLGATVVAVHAWNLPMPTGAGEAAAVALAGGNEPERYQQAAQEVLQAELAGFRQRFPEVPVVERAPEGNPAAMLLEASGGSALLVVGSRGHGGFTGLLLGSTSQSVLHHAGCPVVVTRAQDTDRH